MEKKMNQEEISIFLKQLKPLIGVFTHSNKIVWINPKKPWIVSLSSGRCHNHPMCCCGSSETNPCKCLNFWSLCYGQMQVIKIFDEGFDQIFLKNFAESLCHSLNQKGRDIHIEKFILEKGERIIDTKYSNKIYPNIIKMKKKNLPYWPGGHLIKKMVSPK